MQISFHTLFTWLIENIDKYTFIFSFLVIFIKFLT